MRPRVPLLSAAWLALLGSCSSSDWPQVLNDVRRRHPEVRQLPAQELSTALASPAAPRLLDARTPEEFEVGHLQGARLAPDEAAALEQLRGVPQDAPVVVYCSVGERSSALAEHLAARGFSRVANLEGGIFGWANSGLPLFRSGPTGEEPTDRVHPFDEEWGLLLNPERRAPLR